MLLSGNVWSAYVFNVASSQHTINMTYHPLQAKHVIRSQQPLVPTRI